MKVNLGVESGSSYPRRLNIGTEPYRYSTSITLYGSMLTLWRLVAVGLITDYLKFSLSCYTPATKVAGVSAGY
jgi:hypothetical protein